MKNILTAKDIAKQTAKQVKAKRLRDDFEANIEVYIKDGEKYITYALVRPQWAKLAPKKRAYYEITYYVLDEDIVRRQEGSVTLRCGGERFKTYKESKRFLKTGILCIPNEFELAKLKDNKRFRGHFEVTEIENIELTDDHREWLEELDDE